MFTISCASYATMKLEKFQKDLVLPLPFLCLALYCNSPHHPPPPRSTRQKKYRNYKRFVLFSKQGLAWKTASLEDNPAGRQPHRKTSRRKTISLKDNFTGRLPCKKMTPKGRWPHRKKTSHEDNLRWRQLYMKTSSVNQTDGRTFSNEELNITYITVNS